MLDFFARLYGESIGATRQLCIFSLPETRASWHCAADAAVTAAQEREAAGQDVYYQIGLASPTPRPDGRNNAEEILALPALFLDIDIAHAKRKSTADKKLPADMDEARSVLADLAFPPSLLVDSGHGLHAYWRFREPWAINTPAERQRAKEIARGWGVCAREIAMLEHGWALDMVGDLARIARPVGSVNRKGDTPAPVRLIEDTGLTYQLSDFDRYQEAGIDGAAAPVQDPETLEYDYRPETEARAIAYIAKMPEAIQGQRGSDKAYSVASALTWGFMLHPERAIEIFTRDYNPRCKGPWSAKEIAHKIADAARGPHRKPRGYLLGPRENEQVFQIGPTAPAKPAAPESDIPAPVVMEDMIAQYPTLREPVIDRLLRKGETMNIIAPAKAGKSWLVLGLAMSLVSGRRWLGHAIPGGPARVLLIDNELHAETIAYRMGVVRDSMGLSPSETGRRLEVQSLRGRLKDLAGLAAYLERLPPGKYPVVILDAFYRILPKGTNENDNADMADLLNRIDCLAQCMQSSFILIHHASKGNQSNKSVTDVGSGAGAISRAVDTHLILRPHEEENAAVLDCATRSFPPHRPLGLRWDGEEKSWSVDNDLDVTKLKGLPKKKKEKEESAESILHREARVFADRYVTTTPLSAPRLATVASADGDPVSWRKVGQYMAYALQQRWVAAISGPRGATLYVLAVPPEDPA